MTETSLAIGDIQRCAYELAWHIFRAAPNLTPDEKLSGPEKLQSYIKTLIDVGERDPFKIAKAAMGMMREYEQILHSRGRVMNAPIDPYRLAAIGEGAPAFRSAVRK